MKNLTFGAALFLLIGTPPGFAGGDCDSQPDNAAMLACYDEQWTEAKERTDARLTKLFEILAGHDETFEDDGPNGVQRLEASQEVWELSRDEDCDLVGFAMAGGSMEALITLACLVERQNVRNDWLDGRIAQFQQ